MILARSTNRAEAVREWASFLITRSSSSLSSRMRNGVCISVSFLPSASSLFYDIFSECTTKYGFFDGNYYRRVSYQPSLFIQKEVLCAIACCWSQYLFLFSYLANQSVSSCIAFCTLR